MPLHLMNILITCWPPKFLLGPSAGNTFENLLQTFFFQQQQQQRLHYMDDRRTEGHDHTPFGGSFLDAFRSPPYPFPDIPPYNVKTLHFHGGPTTEETQHAWRVHLYDSSGA